MIKNALTLQEENFAKGKSRILIDYNRYRFIQKITFVFMGLGVAIQVLAFLEDSIRFTIIGSGVVGVALAFHLIFLRKFDPNRNPNA